MYVRTPVSLLVVVGVWQAKGKKEGKGVSNGVAPGHGADANANGTAGRGGGGGGKEERRKQLAALETKVTGEFFIPGAFGLVYVLEYLEKVWWTLRSLLVGHAVWYDGGRLRVSCGLCCCGLFRWPAFKAKAHAAVKTKLGNGC